MKPEGTEYYEYVITYVGENFAVYMDPVDILEDISRFTRLKNDTVNPS